MLLILNKTILACLLCISFILIAFCSRETAPPTLEDQGSSDSSEDTVPSPSLEDQENGDQAAELEYARFTISTEGDDASMAIFRVEEVLNRSPATILVELSTNVLEGEVNFDGNDSNIRLDVHALMSDQTFRDRYVRQRLFPDSRYAVFNLRSLLPLPAGFVEGDEIRTEVSGTLSIKEVETLLSFDIEARNDGDVIFILGRTTFTWEDVGLQISDVTAAQPVVSVADTVEVEILLKLVPSA